MEEKLLELNSQEVETKQENEKLQKVKKTSPKLITLEINERTNERTKNE